MAVEYNERPSLLGESQQKVFRGLLVAGVVAFFVGAIIWPDGRAWPNLLLTSYYLAGIGVAGTLFLATQYATKAAWFVAFRRVPEALTGLLPVAAVMLVAISVFGAHSLYEWTDTDTVNADPILSLKTSWLNGPFFIVRTVLYVVIWVVCARAIVGCSREQDQGLGSGGDGVQSYLRNRKFSCLYLVVFGVTISAASWDWIMSIEPHWFSTMFGPYNFAGVFLSGLSAITILVILLRRRGVFGDAITDEHLHGLGKLVFTFSVFWAYLWFSQYMLIWYSNLPEETTYYMTRHTGYWGPVGIGSLIINWVIPFLILMPRSAKRSETTLLVICTVILVGHWVDLYVMILPPFATEGPRLGLWELGSALVIFSLGGLLFSSAFRKAAPIPTADPLLAESLHHRQ